MERLTERFGNYIRIKGNKSLYGSVEKNRAYLQNAIIRLAAYEDTGLEPNGIMALIAQQLNHPLTLAELRELDGEPVWVADFLVPDCSCYYFRQNIRGQKLLVEPKYYPTESIFVPHYNADDENGAYGTSWLAYRRKPE